jgi:predicted Zn-ribbon and HTH transcriptional regulator
LRQPYDENRACKKCGHTHASSEHKEFNYGPIYEEYILRICRRCGFIWSEDPLDKSEAKVG